MRTVSAPKTPAGQGAGPGAFSSRAAVTCAEAHPFSSGRHRAAQMGQVARAAVESRAPALSGTLIAAGSPRRAFGRSWPVGCGIAQGSGPVAEIVRGWMADSSDRVAHRDADPSCPSAPTAAVPVHRGGSAPPWTIWRTRVDPAKATSNWGRAGLPGQGPFRDACMAGTGWPQPASTPPGLRLGHAGLDRQLVPRIVIVTANDPIGYDGHVPGAGTPNGEQDAEPQQTVDC